jgi:hypothetical protein
MVCIAVGMGPSQRNVVCWHVCNPVPLQSVHVEEDITIGLLAWALGHLK